MDQEPRDQKPVSHDISDAAYKFWSRLGITLLVLFVLTVGGVAAVMISLSHRDWVVF